MTWTRRSFLSDRVLRWRVGDKKTNKIGNLGPEGPAQTDGIRSGPPSCIQFLGEKWEEVSRHLPWWNYQQEANQAMLPKGSRPSSVSQMEHTTALD